MSADRELLELAAKAAGVPLIEWSDEWLTDDKCPWGPGYLAGYRASGDPLYYWNPLTDDGDALRLAVSLDLLVDKDRGWCTAANAENVDISEPIRGDKFAAVRRVIVRAAAEIGRRMP